MRRLVGGHGIAPSTVEALDAVQALSAELLAVRALLGDRWEDVPVVLDPSRVELLGYAEPAPPPARSDPGPPPVAAPPRPTPPPPPLPLASLPQQYPNPKSTSPG